MTIMQQKRGTAAEWASNSTIVLAEGEIGVEYDTGKAKVGDGTSAWSALPYIGGGGDAENGLPAGGTAGQILSKVDETDYNAEWIENYANWTSQLKHEVKLGSAIAKGQAVYVSSADGTNMVVSKASNASEATSSKTIGLLETGGSTNAKVKVITEGLLQGLNTSSATDGDPVWLGTSGNLIYGLASKPVAPAHLVFIGIVTRAHATQGEIFIRPQNGFELNEIHDILIGTGYSSTPSDKDLLSYESSTSLWKNKTFSSLGLATLASPALTGIPTAPTATAGTNTTQIATTAFVGTAVANLVDTAPGTLDTLNELAAALGDDPNFATTVADALALKQPLDADLTAIAGISATSGLLKKTAANTWELDTNSYYLSSNPSGYTSNTGTVTSVSVASANGFAGSVANASTTPAITISTSITGLLKGNGTAISAAISGTDYLQPPTGTALLKANSGGALANAVAGTDYIVPSGTASITTTGNISTTSTGTITSAGLLTASGGIAGATAKNMTVASSYSGSAFNGTRVVMVASVTGATDPTTRPDGTALVAGDIWIDW